MKKSNIRSFVEGLNLSSGQTKRMNCPACGGSNTFTVTNDMGKLTYNCYKLACPVSGAYNTDMTAAEIKQWLAQRNSVPTRSEAEVWDRPDYVVNPRAEHTLFHDFVERWAIPSYGLLYDVKDQRVVFPISSNNRVIDANGRAVGGKLPKWYRYTGNADFYTVGRGSVILLVEDCVSALVASQEFTTITAMAILGTSLTEAHLDEVGSYAKAVVALDPDAIQKTVAYKRQIESWTGVNTIAVKLYDDIKYRNEEDIEALRRAIA